MKQLLVFFVAIMFSASTFAQILELNTQNPITKHNSGSVNNTKGQIYLVDSTISYEGDTAIWLPLSKNVSQSFDANGNISEDIYSEYNASTDMWIKVSKSLMTYDNNNPASSICPKHIDECSVFHWNTNILDWNSDTSYYINQTQYYSTIFEDVVFEKKLIMMNWNSHTNIFIGGLRYDIQLHNGSEYENLLIKVYKQATQSFLNFKKTTFNYNPNDKPQSFIEKNWIDSTNSWENYQQQFFAFSGDNLIQRTEQNWNGTDWENDKKFTFQYDVNNNITEYIILHWDTSSSEWKNFQKKEYTFDSNSNKTSFIDYSWNGTNWIANIKHTYQYNSGNLLTEDLQQYWDNSDSSWYNQFKYTNWYDANNNDTCELTEGWNGTLWYNEDKYVQTYNANNDILSSIYLAYDTTANIWTEWDKTILTYDTNSNLTEKTTLSYCDSSDTWLNENKEDFFYSLHEVTNIQNTASYNFKVYPNPTIGFVNISNPGNNLKAFTISNLDGKTIYKNNNVREANIHVDLSQYEAGIYFIRLQDKDNKVTTQKIIIY